SPSCPCPARRTPLVIEMLINSYPFLFLFLPIVLGISTRLRGSALLVWMTLASFSFYSFQRPFWFPVMLLWTTISNYVLARRLESAGSEAAKKAYLLSGLVLSV